MSKIRSTSKIEATVTLQLTEQEAKALLNMTVYGHKSFLEFFYKNLGRHYLEPHESGVISLFDTIKKELPQHINNIDTLRALSK